MLRLGAVAILGLAAATACSRPAAKPNVRAPYLRLTPDEALAGLNRAWSTAGGRRPYIRVASTEAGLMQACRAPKACIFLQLDGTNHVTSYSATSPVRGRTEIAEAGSMAGILAGFVIGADHGPELDELTRVAFAKGRAQKAEIAGRCVGVVAGAERVTTKVDDHPCAEALPPA